MTWLWMPLLTISPPSNKLEVPELILAVVDGRRTNRFFLVGVVVLRVPLPLLNYGDKWSFQSSGE